jgi:hypothetical protein
MDRCFHAYQHSLAIWEDLARENPLLIGIPRSLLNDTSEASQKKVARMKRNYAFDRARYFLPVAASTNVMLIMSARGWVSLCQFLLSHPLVEAQRLGEFIRGELEIAAPRMLKHAKPTEAHRLSLADEFEGLVRTAKAVPEPERLFADSALSARPLLSVMVPEGLSEADIESSLSYHGSRYAPTGSSLQRTAVRFGWSAIALAEIRDLNRHRTGTKHCPLVPSGFYFALDQVPPEAKAHQTRLLEQAEIGRRASTKALAFLRSAEPSYMYWSLLGTEYPFEHTTTADKFIYEAELRTGVGAHYRYAKHLRDVLALWYERFPRTKGKVLEGSAEPE